MSENLLSESWPQEISNGGWDHIEMLGMKKAALLGVRES